MKRVSYAQDACNFNYMWYPWGSSFTFTTNNSW